MKKILQKTLGVLIVCVAVFLSGSCIYQKYLANVDPAVVKELIRLGVVPTTDAVVRQYEVPTPGDEGAPWDYLDLACKDGGYDLTPYAGKTVTMTFVDIKGTCLDEKIRIYVLSEEDTIACAYLTWSENNGGAPGIFSINDPECNY